MATIHPIRTAEDHAAALDRLNVIFDAAEGSAEFDEAEILVTLIQAYEEKTCPIDPPDPVSAILFRMEQMGMVDADLVPYLGQRSRVTEVLKGNRSLSLNMIRKLHHGLGIPLESLINEKSMTRA